MKQSQAIPKVSVLMPAYNAERYVFQAIDSILSQTFSDFEFIIVNDGSSDGTGKILQGYTDNKIRVIDNHKNLGIIESLNIGIENARGEYLARMDSDDISLPQRLENQIRFLDANPHVGVVGCAVQHINEKGNNLGRFTPPLDHESICAYLLMNNYCRHPTLIIRLKHLRAIGGYDQRYLHAEDYDMLWRLSRRTILANLPKHLLRYRITKNSITSLSRTKQLENAFTISFNALSEVMKNQSVDKNAFRHFWWFYYGDDHYRARNRIFLVEDIRRLKPFWEFLGSIPATKKIWYENFRAFALLIRRTNYQAESEQILATINYYL